MRADITVLVVDDHPLFRNGVVETLADEVDIEIIGEATNAADAIALAKAKRPDVVLLDIGIPGGGFEVARNLTTTMPDTMIVILSASDHQNDVTKALKLGARAYVLKGVGGPELVNVVHGVARGETYVTPSLAVEMLLRRHTDQTGVPMADRIEMLTRREREVFRLVGGAWTNKEIAERLSISDKTVKHHITNILGKLGARNRVEVALLANRGKMNVRD